MNREDMKQRTKKYVLGVLGLSETIPQTTVGRVITSQLVRCVTSVGSNYRAVCRSRSDAEFVAKLSITLEEADEPAYWLEILDEGRFVPSETIKPHLQEINELIAIFVASRKTMQGRSGNGPRS